MVPDWVLWPEKLDLALDLNQIEPTESRREMVSWRMVLSALGSKTGDPQDRPIMQMLREERPPVEIAPAWWSVLSATQDAGWSPEVYTRIRLCRAEYIETLRWSKSIDVAVLYTEARWDSLCTALHPGVYPASVTETLRQIERRLAEVVLLRTHAEGLLRNRVYADPTQAETVATQLYALGELEFEKEVRWVTQLRQSLEGTGALPQGVVYSYVDSVTLPEVPEQDPFAFDTVPEVPEQDPFAFDTVPAGYPRLPRPLDRG